MGTEGVLRTEADLREEIERLRRENDEYRKELAVVREHFDVPHNRRIVAIRYDDVTVDDYKEKQS